ncbi:MAG: hypothetical protein ABEN55_02700 [Bradymonadaceae bacterium]
MTDVRDAGGDDLGDGRKLDGGGVAWDLSINDALKAELKAAGAEIYPREPDKSEYISDVAEQAGFELAHQKVTI